MSTISRKSLLDILLLITQRRFYYCTRSYKSRISNLRTCQNSTCIRPHVQSVTVVFLIHYPRHETCGHVQYIGKRLNPIHYSFGTEKDGCKKEISFLPSPFFKLLPSFSYKILSLNCCNKLSGRIF